MVSAEEAKAKQDAPAPQVTVEPTNLEDRNSSLCPGCGGRLDFWACEAICHYCGLKFTCDE